MNFQSLKSMIDNLVQTYSCPNCQSGVDDTSVEVVGTAGSNLNVEIECPGCGKHSIVRAQVFSLDIPTVEINAEKIDELKEKLSNIKGDSNKINDIQGLLSATENKNSIKDKQIVSLNKNLKKNNFSVADLFKQEEQD